MLANLVHVDEGFAADIAGKLGHDLPPASAALRSVVEVAPSPALSILANPPGTFAGRKLGVLVADGTDAKLLRALRRAFEAAGAVVELVGPRIAGFTGGDGIVQPVDHRIDGGPSVVFDAVALLVSEEGAEQLAAHAPALDFVRDAHAHCKFVGHGPGAARLLERAAVEPDDGYVPLARSGDVAPFLERCSELRFWPREPSVFTV
jgi:catalase